MNERAVVYDITDDWTVAASFSDSERALIVQQDRELCRRADLTIVCSQSLYDSRRDVARRILLLPNGVDAAHYLQSDDAHALSASDDKIGARGWSGRSLATRARCTATASTSTSCWPWHAPGWQE